MNQIQIANLKIAALLIFAVQIFNLAVVAGQSSDNRVNLNLASVEQLQTLPGIGPKLAARIVEHRQKHGPFKRPQDIVIVRGMSAKRFRPIAHLVTVNPAAAKVAR